MDILSIAKAYGMETEFPQEVVRQLVNIPEVINGKEIAGRLDLRNGRRLRLMEKMRKTWMMQSH